MFRRMPALSRQVFFDLLVLFFVATASLMVAPAYSIGLAEPFPEKEAPNLKPGGVRTNVLHALTVMDHPRYPDNFDHLNYADPAAPKRGTLHAAEVGTFH